MKEDSNSRIRPCYEPPEFLEHPTIGIAVEEAKEKYGIKLEKGKFYSRQHALDFCALIRQVAWGERLFGMGAYLASFGSLIYLVSRLIPDSHGSMGILELLVGSYGAALGSVFITEKVLPLYERISSKKFNKNYKKYCEDNGIPYNPQ